jgi:hypothetical protein
MSEVQTIPAVRHRKQRDRDMVGAPGELNLWQRLASRRPQRPNANLTETAAHRGGKQKTTRAQLVMDFSRI